MKERNYNIDFLRGLATIWIIVIHTAFWSGEAYLPAWFKSLSLFLDVPAFMYIAGLSFSYTNSFMKTLKGFLNIWKKFIYFILFYNLILFILFHPEFKVSDMISNLFTIFPTKNSLIVVGGSIWFLPMYFQVTILGSAIILLTQHFSNKKDVIKNLLIILTIFFFMFGHAYYNNNNFVFNVTTIFYVMIYLLGYITSHFKITLKQTITYCIINFILLVIIFLSFNLNISSVQSYKFPPSMAYLLISNFSLIIFFYLKDHLKIKKNNLLNYVGKNAIFFYFAQGISSSFLIKLYGHMPTLNCYLLFVIMLIINISLAVILAIFLEKSYTYIQKKVNLEKLTNKLIPIKK